MRPTRAVTVIMTGSVMVEAGGTVTNGGAVATDATGRAVDATTGDIIMGYAREAGVVNQEDRNRTYPRRQRFGVT